MKRTMSSNSLSFRRRFEPKIVELTNQADKYSREFIETGSIESLRKYTYYCNEIMKLKDYIVEQERKKDDK